MCGIAGLVADERAVLAGGIEDMVEGLRHRGPDADHIRSFGTCALGHTRLRIVDLSPQADQPLANEDGSVWTVFNGEIYNFAELRAELHAAGHRFRSASDTEVLVHLYEEHGADMVRRLRGMFAFAIWDDRRKRLLLCRDRLGIKPLYYRIEGKRLSFASEVQTLTRPGDGLDPAAVHGYLRLGWVPGPGTITPGVLELLPGHTLVWEQNGGKPTQYWSPLPSPGAPAPTTEELTEVLLDAMRRHLVADVSVGLFLSSGVDSVVIGSLAGRVAPGLRTYTVAFDTGVDESVDAGRLATLLGLEHSVVRVGAGEAAGSVGRFIRDMDQPTVDGLNSWIISRAVHDAGLVVALSGLGGDELFAGYSTFHHVPRIVRAGRLLRFLPGGPRLAAATLGRSSHTAHSRSLRAIEAVADGGWASSYAAVRGLFGADELDRFRQVEGGHIATDVIAAPPSVDGPATAVVGHMEMSNYLPFQLLRDTDCMSMAHALEVRVPLLDDRVVELALRGQASDADWDKRRLVVAVDPELAYLADQRKRTFTLPIGQWMRGGLRNATEDALISLGEAGLGFDRRELTKLWHGYLRGQVGWRPVWAAAVLGMWLESHCSAVTTAPPHAHAS